MSTSSYRSASVRDSSQKRLVLPELPRGRGLPGGLGELEVQVTVAEPGGVDGGERAGLSGEGGGESAQRPVEQAYAFGVGADEERVLGVGGGTGRRGRLHTAPPADRAERRLPQGLTAPPAEGTEETGGEKGGADEGFGEPEGETGVGFGGGRGLSDCVLLVLSSARGRRAGLGAGRRGAAGAG